MVSSMKTDAIKSCTNITLQIENLRLLSEV